MLEIGTMMPDAMPLVADILVSNLDAPGSKEVAKRLKKMLPPQLQDDVEAPDPEALAALQTAEQTIQEQQQQIEMLYGQMQQLQSALIDNAKDRDTDLKLQQMKSETALAQTVMQQQGQNERTDAQIQADAITEIAKLAEKEAKSVALPPRKFAPLVAGPQSVDQSAAINALAQIKAVAGTDQNPADTNA
jgi:glutamate-1-semialdehyde aminotransferase